jgi:hypothetical protein
MLIISPRKLVPIFFILSGLISSCTTAPRSTVEPTQTAVVDIFTPASPVPEITPAQTCVNDTLEFFSSDMLDLSFSYPPGYTQDPYNDTVQIAAPDLPGSDLKGRFWLEISDSYNRTAEKIADQDMTFVPGLNPGRWTVTLGGEQAVVLDGMPGQDLVRVVYIVRQQTLYILTFSPTRSKNTAANDQMEALYDAVTSSWAWSPCSVSK